MSGASFIFIVVVIAAAVIGAMLLPIQKPAKNQSPLCPPAKNTDRSFKETLKYASLIPYRDEVS